MVEWWAPHVPNHKLLTAKEMKKVIGLVVGKLMDQAHKSQYDADVCVRSVQASNDAFKAVPVEGSASAYGLAVETALSALEENYWDDAGEHTSRGMIGSLGSDLALILKTQELDEIINIDRHEARQCLTLELNGMAELIPAWLSERNDAIARKKAPDKLREIVLEPKPQKLFQIKGMIFSQEESTETVVKTEVTGKSGIMYFTKMKYAQRTDGMLVTKGEIYCSNICQFPILERRITHKN